jgi:hypothetical protein
MDRTAVVHLLTRGVSRADPLPRRVGVGTLTLTGAALVATTGFIHLHLWSTGYRSIPSIGPLFLVQGIAALVLALAVVAARRLVVTAAGAAFMAASVGGLLASTSGKLFGFHESFAAPFTGMALIVGVAGLAVLTAAAVILMVPGRRMVDTGAPIEPASPAARQVAVPASPVVVGAWRAGVPAGGSSTWRTGARRPVAVPAVEAIGRPTRPRATTPSSAGSWRGGSSSWRTPGPKGPGPALPGWL